MSTAKIKVLIVDDSAFARKVIREVLTADPEIEVVGFARDGLEALEKLVELKPDVVTLDLVMPDLDGLGFLKAMPKENAPKVVIVSVSGADSELVLEALASGAIELVTKPTTLPTDRLYEMSKELSFKIKAAAVAQTRTYLPAAQAAQELKLADALVKNYHGKIKLIVIGTSTGGPQAISSFFNLLPAHFPIPIAIALHIPSGYTAPLAERVSKATGFIFEEARNGKRIGAREAVIAPGGSHLSILSLEGLPVNLVSAEPLESIYHPSVDILFESAARNFGEGVVGIILTGMGNDGLKGAEAIRKAGGRMIAESASSCVVYGMPRVVIEAGLANDEAPLEKIPALLLKYLEQ